jgi:hypothetical protein
MSEIASSAMRRISNQPSHKDGASYQFFSIIPIIQDEDALSEDTEPDHGACRKRLRASLE